MVIITVNRDALEKGLTENPIMLRSTKNGMTAEANEAWPYGRTCVRYMPQAPQADGAVVWIEAESVIYRLAEDKKWRHI